MNLRDEGEKIVRKALLEGPGCGIDEHMPYKLLMAPNSPFFPGEKCPINDAYNVIDALIAAGWGPQAEHGDQHQRNQSQLRKLAAHASYAINGMWPQYDPWPDHIDELCVKLRGIGKVMEHAKDA